MSMFIHDSVLRRVQTAYLFLAGTLPLDILGKYFDSYVYHFLTSTT